MSIRVNRFGSRAGIVAAVVALAPAAAFATDVTVGATGDYTTISAALAGLAGSGHKITVQDGTTLTETVTVSGRSGITICAASPWGATLAPTGNRAFYLETSSAITIEGFRIVGGLDDAIYLAGGPLASSDVKIAGNEIRGASNAANNRGAITVGRGNTNTWIVNNLIRDNKCHGVAFGFDGNVGGTHRMFIVNNTLYRNGGSGIKGPNKEILHIVNNVVLGNGHGSFGGWGLQQDDSVVKPDTHFLQHNVFYKNVRGDMDDPRYWLDAASQNGGTTDANNRTTTGAENSGTFAGLTGVTGTTFAINPQSHAFGEFFVNLPLGNYRIPSTSPAVNAGTNSWVVNGNATNRVPSTDWEGGVRPVGPAVDSGFDERPLLPSFADQIDTDRDGLTDQNEILIYGTDPDVRDTDGDGIEDGVEIGCLTNALSAASPGVGTWSDADQDKIPDSLASPFLSDPNETADPRLTGIDSDTDRVQDFWEFAVNHQPAAAGALVSVSDLMSGSLTNDGIGGKRIKMGDVERDGDVDAADAAALLAWVFEGTVPAAWAGVEGLNDPRVIRDLDVNRDRVVNSTDYYNLLWFTQGLFKYLPTQ